MAENKYQFKGSPAPWSVGGRHIETIKDDSGTRKSGYIEIDSESWAGHILCYKHEISTIKVANANAHLVASAPDLLEACIKSLKWLPSVGALPNNTEIEIGNDTKSIISAIHKALNID